MKFKLNAKTIIAIILMSVWSLITLPLVVLEIPGFILQKYLRKVMPKYQYVEGVELQAPESVWHKCLGWLANFLTERNGTIVVILPKEKGEQFCISICTKVSKIFLWHELGHCVDRNAQPRFYCNMFLDHIGKGARYEKKADLYAYRKAFRELSREEAIHEIQLWCKTLRRASCFSFGLTDSWWRAKLAERYIRRYYQQ